MSQEDKFTPQGQPLSVEELAEYTDNGEVAITRADMELATKAADESLKPYLNASIAKPKS